MATRSRTDHTASRADARAAGVAEDQPLAAVGPHGTGTAASGYLPAQDGPFRCGHCRHFHPAGDPEENDSRGLCDHPRVINDPLVRGRVEAGACCSFFTPLTTNGSDSSDFDDAATETSAQ